jgi:cytochrome c oxidase subunit II
MPNRRQLLLTVISTLLIFAFSGSIYAITEGIPAAQTEIKVVAKRFRFEPAQITVRKGSRVRLVVTSIDVDHGIAINEFGIEKRVKKGATEIIEFSPNKAGKFVISCPVFCGDGHADMTGELVVTDASTASQQNPSLSAVQVAFDSNEPGVAYVEVNGEKIKIDTNSKTFARVEAQTTVTTPTQTVAENESKPHWTTEPYDYQLINVPTPKRIPKRALNVHFSHRFSEPINDSGIDKLFGLDSFSVSSLGFSYGITDRLYVKAQRSPICETQNFCKTIEVGFGYHLLDEAGRSPVALSTYASVEGNDNFTDNFNVNIQAMLARSVTRHVNLFFSPAIHLNSNGNSRFNPNPFNQSPEIAQAAIDLNLGKHSGSFGFGVNARIRPSTSLLFEFVPRVGFKTGQVLAQFDDNTGQFIGFDNRSEPAIGFGIEKRIGRHAFALTFSNSQNTTTSRYNSSYSGLPLTKYVIGFNLYRRLL